MVYPTGGREIAGSLVPDQRSVYDAWKALANLADVAGIISIHATAKAPEGCDEAKLETACSSRCGNSDTSTTIDQHH